MNFRSLDLPNRIILSLSVIAAAIYLMDPFQTGHPVRIAIKGSACIFLAIAAYRLMPTGHRQKLLTLALLFSSGGDIFLALHVTDFFVHGLGSFLIAHLIYISIFAHARDWSPQTKVHNLLSVLVILGGFAITGLLWPHLGPLKAPVVVYVIVICLMAISAIFSTFADRWIIAGALSFVISDSLIAINKFLTPFDAAGPLIWITYMGAQYMLAYAIIKGPQPLRRKAA
ncbi:lysoplasmalogenase [Sneathiella chinensis]|uniref:Lysoplasmalogenase n=1 Tax=Sneathiella chinensis TaxID=349750 RepID=A0ABQ5U1T6_9PROT|nr:lysoplasmalogenase [Sneathiella chinensis]GLQ05798.1 hypothetical protein GCM10007924_10190 [Sneathiella chinensis]